MGGMIGRKQVQESAAAAVHMVLMLAASEVALMVQGCRADSGADGFALV